VRNFPVLLLAIALQAAAPKEQPVGLLLTPGGSQLIRSGNETPFSAKVGEVLFSGDRVKTSAGPASFLFCPEKSSVTLEANSDALLKPQTLEVRAGKLGAKTAVSSCLLPQMARLNVASQQHYGVTMVRGSRPERPSTETLEARIGKLPSDQAAAAKAELAEVDKSIAANSGDLSLQLARAAILEKFGLKIDALDQYRKLADQWKDAVWIKGRIFELEEAIAQEQTSEAVKSAAGAKTLALLIGISKYQKLPDSQWLQFAHADADLFHKHLTSPRGGGLPPGDAVLLTNEKATTAAIRNSVQTFLKNRAGKEDTVIVFFAAHGIVETASRQAFIVTYDSDPQDLPGTALPMADVQVLLQEKLTAVKRVIAFVDVCRSGTIGTIRSSTVNSSVERLAEAEGEIFGLMASRPKEFSFEGPQFGGGHGAFSHALIKGLSGSADKNGDKIVNVTEIIDFVRELVQKGTEDKQHPRDFGTMENTVPLADVSKSGIEVSRWQFLYDSSGEPLRLAAAAQVSAGPPEAPDVTRYREAIAAGRLLPDEPGGAFPLLARLRTILPPERYLIEENLLRIELENRGQQVILRYLTGDQVPQTRADFDLGARYFEAARRLTPESLLLDSRESFCRGRALLFDRNYSLGAGLLERAAGLDSDGAHSYNSLGIAYLEQAGFPLAIAAFRDSIKRAPRWAYPRHNLALALAETGDYSGAVRAYQDAMKLAPSYSYLPYNLGLLYQRINRKKEAATAYRKAISLSPDSPEAYNALGALEADQRRDAEAEALYRSALSKQAGFLPARHNLAILIARKKGREAEAVSMLELNLAASPDHLPSRLALAEVLVQQGKRDEAARQYEALLARRAGYPAARVRLAGLLLESGEVDQAILQLNEALRLQPNFADAFEILGDAERKRNREEAARAAYQRAADLATDPAARKRIKSKRGR
jgi:tetratricopeptide (TPR) repeat protein